MFIRLCFFRITVQRYVKFLNKTNFSSFFNILLENNKRFNSCLVFI